MKNTKTLIRQSVNWTQRNALFLAITLLPSALRAASGGGDISVVTEGLKTVLNVIFMIGFMFGVVLIISGASKISGGEGDAGKRSIIGGGLMAAAGAIMAAFFNLFDRGESTLL